MHLDRNDSVMKTLRNYCSGKQQFLWKTSFHLNINDTVVKTLCCIYFILDKKLPGRKTFSYLRLTVSDIYLSVVAIIVLFVKLFDAVVIANSIWMVITYWYICIFYRRENNLVVQKPFYMTSSCTIFIYCIEESNASQ